MPLIRALDRYDGFLVDLDGVIYLRRSPVTGAAEFLEEVRSSGRRLIFLTNNSSRTREDYVSVLSGFGIESSVEEIVTSALAASRFVAGRYPGKSVFVVGEEGLRKELVGCGIRLVGEPPADLVVVGIDWSFTYEKLKRATIAIRSGARFISTNRDPTYPTEKGLYPGAGSIVSAIQTASGKRPLNVGKPSRWIFDLCAGILGIESSRVAVIGDRVETDIVGARRAGMGGVLVLTGVTSKSDLDSLPLEPDLVVESVGSLLA
jgi:4-nitrophenyl phosphatase